MSKRERDLQAHSSPSSGHIKASSILKYEKSKSYLKTEVEGRKMKVAYVIVPLNIIMYLFSR